MSEPLETFWDGSALSALLLAGPNTAAAAQLWHESARGWCWRWTLMEVEAVLSRRQAPVEAWTAWRRVAAALNILDFDSKTFDALRQFNRTARLSAAVAGQLFVFDRASTALPRLKMVSFDRETRLACEMLALPLA